MKRFALILGVFVTTGCAVAPKPAPAPESAHVEYQPAAASALVFDSPLTPAVPLLGLDRDDRQPSAFLGFDDTIVESYFLYTDDQQGSFPCLDNYDREAISTRVSTRTR